MVHQQDAEIRPRAAKSAMAERELSVVAKENVEAEQGDRVVEDVSGLQDL